MSLEDKTVIVQCTCPLCGAINKVEVSAEGLAKWKDGEFIQAALPELSAEQREIIMTGTCIRCQNDLFNLND